MALVIYDRDAGMCTGVKRSIDGALKTAINVGGSKEIVTYGELIHNPVIITKLKKRGIKIVNTLNRITLNNFVIIRAHGIPPEDENYFKENGIEYLDLTCPIVKSIHKKITDYKDRGYKIMIVGHPKHPETIGHMGYAGNAGFVVSNPEDLKINSKDQDTQYRGIDSKTLIIAQTTISEKLYQEVIIESKAKEKGATVLYTICPFVLGRQRWIDKMSRESDAAIIIGGKNSSNTRRLYELAKSNCETYWIVRPEELPINDLKNYTQIALTAGASTADETIQEVLHNLKQRGFQITEG